jgi:hypothetical protein
MKIPSKEIQERVFGYYTEELPPEGSIKAKAYELLTDPLLTETLAETWKRMNAAIEWNIVKPSVERTSRLKYVKELEKRNEP